MDATVHLDSRVIIISFAVVLHCIAWKTSSSVPCQTFLSEISGCTLKFMYTKLQDAYE